LIGELWSELGTLYPEGKCAPFHPSDISGEGTAFVVASLGELSVGCGAFQPLPDGDPSIAEVKRMYVETSARGRGVACSILAKLEELATDLGYRIVRLETGTRQPAAIHLYEAAGFHRIDRYGHYISDPLSLCFEKKL
jgi:putative acetyltransferase